MFTNKPEFRVKEVIQLSKLSSEILNNLLIEANVYLTKRILTYVLAQQISIQIASDRELVHLRGYASELEDYTLLQLLNFTDSQGIEVDTFDIKFRLWTVVFNNLRELSIRDSWIQKHLDGNEPCFEYTQDLFNNLTRFIDEPNDIDGQPFIIAKESLTRFSSKEEVEALAKSIGVAIPSVLDKEATVDFILRDLEDTNPDLKNELMKKSVKEIQKFAKENYISTEFSFTKKELVNFILDNYEQLDEHIRNIEYQKHLEIPSLYKYQAEETQHESFKPSKVFDQELKEMIATIINPDEDDSNVISEEKSKEELDKVMNDIAKTYSPAQRDEDQVLLKRFDELEKRIQEKNNYDPNMIALMNKINHMETQLSPNTVSREDMLMKKIEGLENKISRLAKGENPDISEAKQVEQTLLNRIAELEEKLSFQKSEDYSKKMDSVPSTEMINQVHSTNVKVLDKKHKDDAKDEDYEYDMDHFVPKVPAIEGLIPEQEKESDDQLPSETEKLLLDKLAAIEEKLKEKDTEIEILRDEVEASKKEAQSIESKELLIAKAAQEAAEKKLAEQNKELQVLRFLSKKDDQEEIQEDSDELLELEKLDPYNQDDLENWEETEDLDILDEEVSKENVEKDVEDNLIFDEVEETDSEDDIDEILGQIGVSKLEKKERKGFSFFSKKKTEEEDYNENSISEDETLEEIMEDIEEMEIEQEMDNVAEEVLVEDDADDIEDDKEKKTSEFDAFIEEIHSSKDKDKIKVRRRHTLKPITVFWKAFAIWAMLVSIGVVILLVYNNL